MSEEEKGRTACAIVLRSLKGGIVLEGGNVLLAGDDEELGPAEIEIPGDLVGDLIALLSGLQVSSASGQGVRRATFRVERIEVRGAEGDPDGVLLLVSAHPAVNFSLGLTARMVAETASALAQAARALRKKATRRTLRS